MKKEIKKMIIEYLKTTDTHPTAKEIYTSIKIKSEYINEKIFLEELAALEKNKIISYVISLNNIKHYDIKLYNHYHFICENCGVVRDLLINKGAIQMLNDHAQKLINSFAKITKINLSFQGICHNCRKNKNNHRSKQ